MGLTLAEGQKQECFKWTADNVFTRSKKCSKIIMFDSHAGILYYPGYLDMCIVWYLWIIVYLFMFYFYGLIIMRCYTIKHSGSDRCQNFLSTLRPCLINAVDYFTLPISQRDLSSHLWKRTRTGNMRRVFLCVLQCRLQNRSANMDGIFARVNEPFFNLSCHSLKR